MVSPYLENEAKRLGIGEPKLRDKFPWEEFTCYEPPPIAPMYSHRKRREAVIAFFGALIGIGLVLLALSH